MSIENQRTFLLRWAEERGWPVQEIYSDDGYTGTNFDRPAFRRMLRDIEAGRIDTVVTKDLSRLGRDQIGTMHYYQRYFPAHGVRYLAAAEGFDTAGGAARGSPFHSWRRPMIFTPPISPARSAPPWTPGGGAVCSSAPPRPWATGRTPGGRGLFCRRRRPPGWCGGSLRPICGPVRWWVRPKSCRRRVSPPPPSAGGEVRAAGATPWSGAS